MNRLRIGYLAGSLVLLLTATSWVHGESRKDEASKGELNKSEVVKGATAKGPPGKADAESKSEPAKAVKGLRPAELPAFTKEREAAALMFVRSHHPELAELLAQLRQHNQKEYERGVRELFRDSERLAQWQERSPKRYETELEAWKLHSRILVLVAKLSMTSDPQVEQLLRQTLAEEAEFKRRQLTTERDRIATRLAEIDRELERKLDEQVELRMSELLRGAAGRVPAAAVPN